MGSGGVAADPFGVALSGGDLSVEGHCPLDGYEGKSCFGVFCEAFDEFVGASLRRFVDFVDDLDAGGFELLEASAAYERIWIGGWADDAFDAGVDDCLGARGRCGVGLVGFEGAVDSCVGGGVWVGFCGDSDGYGFGVWSGTGLGSTLSEDGFAVGCDDDGADRWSGCEAAGDLLREIEGAMHEIHVSSMQHGGCGVMPRYAAFMPVICRSSGM